MLPRTQRPNSLPSSPYGPQMMTISNTIRTANALSGLLLVLFLLVHLGGIISALVAKETFEAYASYLHQSSWLMPLEVFLLLIFITHIVSSITKSIRNKQAGNTANLQSRRQAPLAALASRSKVLAGLTTLGFLALHLQELRLPRPMDGHEREVLVNVLQRPLTVAIYIIGAMAIGLHLFHGAEAAHRNLGWLTPKNGSTIRKGGIVLAAAVSGGYILISIGLAIGGQA